MRQWRVYWLVLVPVLLIVTGTFGYWVIEPGYSLFDSLYMTVITITTVGYGEIPHPLSNAGRAFTMVLLLGGVFTMFYAATELIRSIITGEVTRLLGGDYMARTLAGLKDHTIICGYGRMGRHVAREFERQGVAFVIVDVEAELRPESGEALLTVVGDATSDDVLRRAGVERARAVVAALPSDADNLYITMSARLLNAKLTIVARAETEEAEKKLLRAGADRVIAPYALGGSKIAQAVLRPTVLEFIELATKTEHLEVQIEQTEIKPGSALAGVTLSKSRLRNDFGLVIVAIKKKHGAMIYTPPADTALEVGDILLALGRRSQLDQLDAMAAGRPPA